MFRVGDTVKVKENSDKKSFASRIYSGQIGTIIKSVAPDHRWLIGYVILDIEKEAQPSGLWWNEIELMPTQSIRMSNINCLPFLPANTRAGSNQAQGQSQQQNYTLQTQYRINELYKNIADSTDLIGVTYAVIEPPINTKCICGVASLHGGGKHSDWCNIKN